MQEKGISDFLKHAYELGRVKDVTEAFDEFDTEEEIHKGDIDFFLKESLDN